MFIRLSAFVSCLAIFGSFAFATDFGPKGPCEAALKSHSETPQSLKHVNVTVSPHDPTEVKVEIQGLRPVRKQCLGTCWLNAGALNFEYTAQTLRDDVPTFSVDYLMVRDILDRANLYMQYGAGELLPRPGMGAHPDRFVELSQSYGGVAADKFRLRDNIDWQKVESDMRQHLKFRQQAVTQAKLTHDLAAYHELWDEAITWLTDYIEKNVSRETLPNQDEMYVMMDYFQEFDGAIYDSGLEPIEVYPTGMRPKITEERDDKPRIEANPAEILRRIEASIGQGIPLLCGLSWTHNFMDDLRGEVVFGPLNRDPLLREKHAVVIVGYTSRKGKLTELRLQNSWGTAIGDGGFYKITVENFQKSLLFLEYYSPEVKAP